jgi:hypothetical protein
MIAEGWMFEGDSVDMCAKATQEAYNQYITI